MAPLRTERALARAAVFAALAAFAGRARASDPFDDPYDLPDTPRAPTLPELTHPDIELTSESTLGVAAAKPELGRSNASLWVQRFGVEVPLGTRRWFVGANYELAAGASGTGAPTHVVGGNVETYGRTVWAIRTGLAFGGGLGLVLPAAQFDDAGNAGSVAFAAATVRTWDYAFFRSHAFGLRPFLDARTVDGHLVVQFRQGIDASLAPGHDSRKSLAAMSALYVGFRAHPVLGVGIEAFEYYLLDDAIEDRRRAQLFVSPSVRVMTRYVHPAFSAYTNMLPSIDPGVARVWGFRLAVTFVWNATTRSLRPEDR